MVCAVLLLTMDGNEERAFWMMVALLESYDMADFYRDGLARLQGALAALGAILRVHRPALATALEAEGMVPHCYATPWFVTCFAYDMNIGNTARVLDGFFCGPHPGPAWLFRVGLAFLVTREERLLQRPAFADLVLALKDMKSFASGELTALLAGAATLPLAELAAKADASQQSSPPPAAVGDANSKHPLAVTTTAAAVAPTAWPLAAMRLVDADAPGLDVVCTTPWAANAPLQPGATLQLAYRPLLQLPQG